MVAPDTMKTMIDKLAITEENEISCDEVHELIDQFSEMKIRGENVSEAMPMLQKHLDMCPDCREEFMALLRALEVENELGL